MNEKLEINKNYAMKSLKEFYSKAPNMTTKKAFEGFHNEINILILYIKELEKEIEK